jgi:hypothetical protein
MVDRTSPLAGHEHAVAVPAAVAVPRDETLNGLRSPTTPTQTPRHARIMTAGYDNQTRLQPKLHL